MSESFLNGRVVLHSGDSREVIKTLPDCSVDSVVSDPPYALASIVKRYGSDNAASAKGNEAYMRASAGFMGKKWDTGEVAFDPEFWREVYRVLKPGGHLIAMGGTRTYHRLACAIEDAGFDVRDMVSWLYGSGFPKSHDVSKGIDRAAGAVREVVGRKIYGDGHIQNSSAPAPIGALNGMYRWGNEHMAWEDLPENAREYFKQSRQNAELVTAPATDAAIQWQGWGTALKPACEPICLARKPLSEKTVAANVLRWGTGAINVDGCRVDAPDGLSSGGVNQHEGTGWGFGDIRSTPHARGRWPANVCHDGSDEVVAAFPDNAGQRGPEIRNRQTAKTDMIYGKFGEPSRDGIPHDLPGSAARFFYGAKADSDDRVGSKHPTVKPIDLMQWLCRLVTPKGGTVLDPFAGTGTTAEAAHREGFNCVLIEREAEYQADIRRRVSLILTGPDERKRESVKAKVGELPFEEGSLFA